MALNTERVATRRYSEINEHVLKTIHERFGRHLDTNGPRRDDGTGHRMGSKPAPDRRPGARDTWTITAALEQLTE